MSSPVRRVQEFPYVVPVRIFQPSRQQHINRFADYLIFPVAEDRDGAVIEESDTLGSIDGDDGVGYGFDELFHLQATQAVLAWAIHHRRHVLGHTLNSNDHSLGVPCGFHERLDPSRLAVLASDAKERREGAQFYRSRL